MNANNEGKADKPEIRILSDESEDLKKKNNFLTLSLIISWSLFFNILAFQVTVAGASAIVIIEILWIALWARHSEYDLITNLWREILTAVKGRR